jgi:hypothetical protein
MRLDDTYSKDNLYMFLSFMACANLSEHHVYSVLRQIGCGQARAKIGASLAFLSNDFRTSAGDIIHGEIHRKGEKL